MFRAKLDNNDALRHFCEDLEAACVEVIDNDGVMTKDLALAIHGKDMKREHWVITDVYMDAVNVRTTYVSYRQPADQLISSVTGQTEGKYGCQKGVFVIMSLRMGVGYLQHDVCMTTYMVFGMYA